eukprot:260456-Chlamydomonas_euryale.AAC.4
MAAAPSGARGSLRNRPDAPRPATASDTAETPAAAHAASAGALTGTCTSTSAKKQLPGSGAHRVAAQPSSLATATTSDANPSRACVCAFMPNVSPDTCCTSACVGTPPVEPTEPVTDAPTAHPAAGSDSRSAAAKRSSTQRAAGASPTLERRPLSPPPPPPLPPRCSRISNACSAAIACSAFGSPPSVPSIAA